MYSKLKKTSNGMMLWYKMEAADPQFETTVIDRFLNSEEFTMYQMKGMTANFYFTFDDTRVAKYANFYFDNIE